MGYIRPANGYGISDSWQGHRDRVPPSGEPGTDYAFPHGTTLVAPASGTIAEVKTSTSGASGRRLLISTDDGNTLDLIHLSEILVHTGQHVAQGDVIARSGASAWGNEWGVGAHTHVSLWLGGGPYSKGWAATVDFEAFVKGGNGGGAANAQWPARALYGEAWTLAIQRKLVSMGHKLAIDGKDGPETQSAVKFEQQMSAKHGFRINGRTIAVDGIAGPEFNAFLDWWLAKGQTPAATGQDFPTVTYDNISRIGDVIGLQKIAQRWGYSGYLDNAWGDGSKAGLKAYIDANYGGSIGRWLRERWDYSGNDQLGPVMIAALQRANAANKAELSAIR